MWFSYRPVIEEMIDRVGLTATLTGSVERRDLIREFQEKRIRVKPFKGASVIQVSCDWNNAEQAKDIVATLTDVFIQRYEDYNQNELDRQTSFLARQVDELKDRIKEKEASLSEFQKSARLLSTRDGLQSIDDSETTLELELSKAEYDLDTLNYQKKQLLLQLDSLGKTAPVNQALVGHLTTPTSPLYEKLKQAETLEKSLALLEQQESDEGTGRLDPLGREFGRPSPVNEAVRKSLVQNSPLRSQLLEVISLEKELRNLRLQYMDKHDSVIVAMDKLNDASGRDTTVFHDSRPINS